MNFDESLEYLLNLGNEVLAMKLGLENISKLLKSLNNPQNNYLKIQIAGTNGKGSTCAFLETICLQAKINVGLTTSPHLVSITERVRINGANISEDEFARYATLIRTASENLVEAGELETVPTYFEQVTAIALTAFAENDVELAILETGLGGRYDATTAARAEICAITRIDYDHQQYLGETLPEIAAEKAAIIHQNSNFAVVPQSPEVMNVILERCHAVGVESVIADCNYFKENQPEVSFKLENRIYSNINLGLKGEHQRENACLAICLAEILEKDFQYRITVQNIIAGLENARHSGRLQWLEISGVKILLDGAHNISGAKALRNYLQKDYADSEITFVFGAMNDKNLDQIGEVLFPLAENLILTEPDNPRSAEAGDLEKTAEKIIDKSKIFKVENVRGAIESAIKIVKKFPAEKDAFICITGSLYLVGEAQKQLQTLK